MQNSAKDQKTSELKLINLNTRSYLNNRNALEYLILSNKFDILIFTETWLNKPISIPTTRYKYIDLLSIGRGQGIRIIIRSNYYTKII